MIPVTLAVLALNAPVPKAKEPVQIDLNDVYSTIEMKGLKKARVDNPAADGNDLEVISRAARRVGASNIFLVRGDSIAEVLFATRTLYGDGMNGNGKPIVGHEVKKRGEVWVGAFLGNSFTSPAAYAIHRIELDGQTIRVVFSQPRGAQADDMGPYFIWAKIGKLEPGKYQLELVNADQKDEVVMCRKIEVQKESK